MKTWPALLVMALAVGASGCGNNGASSGGETQSPQCRAAWEGLAQRQGENGNPGGSATALNQRWDELYAEAKEAGPSGRTCGEELTRAKREFDALEDLMYGAQRYDVPFQLKQAEHDAVYYLGLRRELELPATLPAGVPEALAILRVEAPEAAQEIGPVLEEVGDLSQGRVKELLKAVSAAAKESPSFERAKSAKGIIDDAGLREE